MKPTCATCDAYLAANDKGGYCRVNPPTPMVVGMIQNQFRPADPPQPLVNTYFPSMLKDGWCRQHRPVENFSEIDLKSIDFSTIEGSA